MCDRQIKLLENQLLTGYKLVEHDGKLSSVKLTEEEKIEIQKQITKLKEKS